MPTVQERLTEGVPLMFVFARARLRVAIIAIGVALPLIAVGSATATGSDDYEAVVLADGPLAYWRLGDTGPAVIDLSGNGHHGTAHGAVGFWESSLTDFGDNTAISTSGSNRVEIPAFEKHPAGATGYTVEYWVRLNSAPTSFSNIVGDGEGLGDFYLMSYLTADRRIRPHLSPGNAPYNTDSATQLTVGAGYHVVTTWKQATGEAITYLNGAVDRTVYRFLAPTNTANPMYIGKDNREPGADLTIDEVAIYDRPLSAAEVLEHYAAASDFDGDNVADPFDTFPDSDMRTTVVIGECDSGATNHVFGDGATFSDLLAEVADDAPNHGKFVSGVTRLADNWKRDGLISGRAKGQITSCAARSDVGR